MATSTSADKVVEQSAGGVSHDSSIAGSRADSVSGQPSVQPHGHAHAASRVLFVDLLRFVAAFQMLQGHTIAALLVPGERSGFWYVLWSAARGLTSVAFLYVAGLSFFFATERERTASATKRVAERARRVRRALLLIALGYALHAPLAACLDPGSPAAHIALAAFAGVDVLQCIGISLLALEGLFALTASHAALGVACVSCAGLLLAATPFGVQLVPSGWLAPLIDYLSPRAGSLFPLLPWASYVFAGAGCAALLRAELRVGMPGRLFALALVCGALGVGLRVWPVLALSADALRRLAYVLCVSAGLALGTQRLRRLPSWVSALAAETLFLYVFHVLVVYGQPFGLAATFGRSLGAAQAIGMAGLVVATSCGLGLLSRSAQELLRARRLAAADRTG